MGVKRSGVCSMTPSFPHATKHPGKPSPWRAETTRTRGRCSVGRKPDALHYTSSHGAKSNRFSPPGAGFKSRVRPSGFPSPGGDRGRGEEKSGSKRLGCPFSAALVGMEVGRIRTGSVAGSSIMSPVSPGRGVGRTDHRSHFIGISRLEGKRLPLTGFASFHGSRSCQEQESQDHTESVERCHLRSPSSTLGAESLRFHSITFCPVLSIHRPPGGGGREFFFP